METLSIAGNLASLLGFVVSCYVLWDLQKIKKQFIFKARIPAQIESLEGQAKELADSLSTNDIRAIEQKISVANSILKNLSEKANSDIRKEIVNLIKKIQDYYSISSKDLGPGMNKAYEIYSSMLGIVEALRQQHEDSKWS